MGSEGAQTTVWGLEHDSAVLGGRRTAFGESVAARPPNWIADTQSSTNSLSKTAGFEDAVTLPGKSVPDTEAETQPCNVTLGHLFLSAADHD